jgi:hypothetical protein
MDAALITHLINRTEVIIHVLFPVIQDRLVEAVHIFEKQPTLHFSLLHSDGTKSLWISETPEAHRDGAISLRRPSVFQSLL